MSTRGVAALSIMLFCICGVKNDMYVRSCGQIEMLYFEKVQQKMRAINSGDATTT